MPDNQIRPQSALSRQSRTSQAGGLAAFGVALAALNQHAEGAIVFHEASGGKFSDGPSPSFAGVSFNPLTGDIGTTYNFPLQVYSCGGSLLGESYFSCSGNLTAVEFVGDGTGAIAFLSSMSMVNNSVSDWVSGSFNSFSGAAGFMTGSFPLDDSPFYIGFRVTSSDMSFGDFHYGYAKLSYLYDGSDQTVSLYNFAYEDVVNQGIAVSAIPEPGMVGAFMGLVVFGLIGYKRLRKKLGIRQDAHENTLA